MEPNYGGTSSADEPLSSSTNDDECEPTDTDSLLTADIDHSSMKSKDIERPKELDPWSMANIAIMSSYFCVGFGMSFLGTPLSYYMIDTLYSTAEQQNVVGILSSLPWSFKLLYGFLSDGVPINGQRRKPYFIIGWCIYIASNFWLALLGEPSIVWIAGLMLAQTMGYMLSDVMTDTMVVERSKSFEDVDSRGSFQAAGYTIRTAGTCFGSVFGAILYNKSSWGWGLTISQIFVINAMLPAVILIPLVPSLLETPPNCPPPSIQQQWDGIFALVQRRAVWQPCAFIFIYNVFQISNAAWGNFLVLGLGFGSWELGVITIIASFASWAGIVVYKRFFFTSSWRGIYLVTTALSTFFSLLQLCLITGNTLGLSDLWFATGDAAVWSFILYIQFLPMCIMYSGMCPDGSEGASYAMLTTLSNMGGTVGSDVSTLLTGIWNVSNSAIEKGRYTGMFKLTLLTSLLQVVPLPLLFLIPRNKEEQIKLQKSPETSFAGGVIFVGVLVVSLIATVVENVIEIA